MNVWNAEATLFSEYWTSFSAPARERVADALAITHGTRVLDVGCGGGHFCALALERGARVSGIDAAPAMIEIAAATAPDADLCVGPMTALPWPDGAFDAVTGFNSLQFAEDPVAALQEWLRVLAPGGAIGLCVWGPRAECELEDVENVLRDSPPGPRFYERMLDVVADAGLEPVAQGRVAAPFIAPDDEHLVQAMLFDARGYGVPEDVARPAVLAAAAPFKRRDGSYRLENVFRYVIARRSSARPTRAGS